MSDPQALSGRSKFTALGIGVLLGLLIGIGTSLLFPLLILGPVIGLTLAVMGMRDAPAGPSSLNTGAGLLIGSGGVYLLGALNTLNSCQGQDVCGGASALPFLGYAVVILAAGLVFTGIALTRTN